MRLFEVSSNPLIKRRILELQQHLADDDYTIDETRGPGPFSWFISKGSAVARFTPVTNCTRVDDEWGSLTAIDEDGAAIGFDNSSPVDGSSDNKVVYKNFKRRLDDCLSVSYLFSLKCQTLSGTPAKTSQLLGVRFSRIRKMIFEKHLKGYQFQLYEVDLTRGKPTDPAAYESLVTRMRHKGFEVMTDEQSGRALYVLFISMRPRNKKA